ncbi:MAG: 1-acyl-sn-glycerol-3-phosphate acyltransferase [Synechococcales cyanobacterium RM1_1_8]|nr:1-acyl-sn-glycerol-3-phosphate acyltransferase [Synechococcales cyanobacterium RM1_1_8]
MDTSKELKPYISPWLSALVYRFGKSLLLPYYFGSVTVLGQENMPESGPVILAPMHRSRWDAFMVPNVGGRFAIGREVHFMVTTDEMKSLQGWVIRRMGGFPIDTRRPSRESLRCAINLLREEKVLAVFPEGNIFKDGQVHPLKSGLSRMALQAANGGEVNIKVVPIGLHYDKPDVPLGSNAIIRVGKPLETHSYRDLPGRKAAEALNQDLTAVLERFQAEFNGGGAALAQAEAPGPETDGPETDGLETDGLDTEG